MSVADRTLTPEEFIEKDDIGVRELLCDRQQEKLYKFAHRTFQEYLTSVELTKPGNETYAIAMDDRRAINKALSEAGFVEADLQVLKTQDIVIKLIQLEFLSIKQADAILIDWSTKYRFRLKISSFAELL